MGGFLDKAIDGVWGGMDKDLLIFNGILVAILLLIVILIMAEES